MMEEDILRKIRYLLALKDSSNEHESALAAQRVQELLTNYNLSMAEVESSQAKASAKTDVGGGKREEQRHNKAAMYQYQRDLMAALAKNNFCMHWITEKWRQDPKGNKPRWMYDSSSCTDTNRGDQGRTVKTHMLLGREVNIVTTQITYDYLIEVMDRLLPWQGMQKRGKEALLWLAGCTARLVDRLNQQREEMVMKTRTESANAGTGIVLASFYSTEEDSNEDARYGNEPGTMARKRAETQQRYRLDREKQTLLEKEGMPTEEAWYVARGLTPPITEEETPAERIKREAKEERDRARYRKKRDDEDWRRYERRNHPAYQAGSSTGGGIGLDTQVKDRKQEVIR